MRTLLVIIKAGYNAADQHVGWLKPLMIGSVGVLGSWGIQEWTDITALLKNILSITVLLLTGLIAIYNFLEKRNKRKDETK